MKRPFILILLITLLFSVSASSIRAVLGQAEVGTASSRIMANDEVALELLAINDFELVWDSKGSGADYDGSFWRPVLPDGYYALGHHGAWGYYPSIMFAAKEAKELVPEALAKPDHYMLIWQDKHSGAYMDGSFWKPVPPNDNYECLGIVAQEGYTEPDLDQIRCVRKDLVVPGKVGEMIWIDEGTGATYSDFGAWHVVPKEDDGSGIHVGTFTGHQSWNPPDDSGLYVLDRRFVSISQANLTTGTTKGLAFDGADDHVILPQDFPNVDDFTFVAWIYWNGGDSWQRIFDFGNGSSSMYLTPKNDHNQLLFEMISPGKPWESLGHSAALPSGEWHHITVTLDGDNGKLYLDGELVDFGKIMLDPRDIVGNQNWLGRSQNPKNPYFDGEIDEVAVFNRALSQNEIQDIINSGWDGLDDGMVMGLHMDEDPSPHNTQLADVSGLGNYGKVYRAALELLYIEQLDQLWNDADTDADDNGAFWRPVVPAGYHALGHKGQGHWHYPSDGIYVARELEKGALAKPKAYEAIWTDRGLGGSAGDIAFYKPVAPEGYKCLGTVGWNYNTPPLDLIHCVRQDLVVPGKVGDYIWDDEGTWGSGDFSSWEIVPKEDDGRGINIGTFFGHRSHDKPSDNGLWVPDIRKVQRFAPREVLELVLVDQFDTIYHWLDTAYLGAFFRPVAPPGYHILGHIGQGQHELKAQGEGYKIPRGYTVAVRELQTGSLALQPPGGYRLFWSHSNKISFWKPIAPNGYVCLGMVVQNSLDPPDTNAIRCVRQDLAAPGGTGNSVWNDEDSGNPVDLGTWYIVPEQQNGIDIGTFTANYSWTHSPKVGSFVLDARSVKIEEKYVNQLSSDEVDELIKRYGPILYHHPDEEYFLDDAKSVLDGGQTYYALELNWALVHDETEYDTFELVGHKSIPTTSQTLMEYVQAINENIKPFEPYNCQENGDCNCVQGKDCNFRIWLNIPDPLKPGDLSRAKTYVRVLPWNTFFTDIQFWFFYSFNGPGKINIHFPTIWEWEKYQMKKSGRHYGDWEHVTLRFRNDTKQLHSVFLSAHSGGHWFGRNEFDLLGWEKPLVYSAHFSHAQYASASSFIYKILLSQWFGGVGAGGYLYDITGIGKAFNSSEPYNYEVVSADMFSVPEPDWFCFRGRWGKYEPIQEDIPIPNYPHPLNWTEVGAGPEGPPTKKAWYLGDTEHIDNGWPRRLQGTETICSLSATIPEVGEVGRPITFEADVVTGANVRYSWDFGDESTGRGSTVQHSYRAPGTYEVTVIASNPVGQRVATMPVTVEKNMIHLPVITRN